MTLELHDKARSGQGLDEGDMERLRRWYDFCGKPRNEAELALTLWWMENHAG